MPSTFDVENLGQVFTPKAIVDLMISLKRNSGAVLEPSSGDGAFSKLLGRCTSIEIDPNHALKDSLCMDFFDYSREHKFETIIGNPPYVRYQDIPVETKLKLDSQIFDSRTNLYLFFIEKCLDHLTDNGELIFIVPRDFIKSTSSIRLNRALISLGTITHYIDLGDSRIFHGAIPNCVIFRFEKNQFNRECAYAELKISSPLTNSLEEIICWQKKIFSEVQGHFTFASFTSEIILKDIAEVKVGGVSGMDTVFADEIHGNLDFVCSETVRTGKTRRMIYLDDRSSPPSFLERHKPALISRKIKKFDESNWWHWGRGFPSNDKARIYVNAKTRVERPFYLHPCNNFDGSVLAIFPKIQSHAELLCQALNEVNWIELGFNCDGRFLFSQRSLENTPLPKSFKQFLT